MSAWPRRSLVSALGIQEEYAERQDAPPMAEHAWLSLLDKLRVEDIMTPEV